MTHRVSIVLLGLWVVLNAGASNSFAATSPTPNGSWAGARITCEFKTGAYDTGQKLIFSLPAPGPQGGDEALPAELKRPDLLGLERPLSIKADVRTGPAFQDSPLHRVPGDELASVRVGGLFTAPPKNENSDPKTFRFTGRLQLNLNRIKESKIQWTVEEGVFGFMGLFESRRSNVSEWVNAGCEIRTQ